VLVTLIGMHAYRTSIISTGSTNATKTNSSS
jgi:hypothetical protein